MIWFVVIVVLAIIISSSKSGATSQTIDKVQPSPVINKIVTGQSGPANRKPTIADNGNGVADPAPRDAGSKFLSDTI